jgi:two-component system sensor histidine kinase AlgZ
MTGKESRPTDPVVFFIPDLCNVQAVFLLVLVAELLAMVLGVNRMGLREFSWQGFALLSLGVQWTVLLSAAGLCQLRPRLAHWPRERAAALSYALVLAMTALVSLSGQWLLGGLLAERWQIDRWALLDHLLIAAVLAGIALRYFYLTQELRLRQKAELEARIQALQSRIRPHFLFNSMNSIASLIGSDPVAAETAVEDLAGLFRASLAQTSTEVSVEEELDLCRRYLRIEQLRLGDRLRVLWDVETVPTDLPIPALSLQPLLENAIYHGIQVRPDGGEVTISGRYRDGEVRLTVSNPLADPLANAATPRRSGNHMALDNIGHRLRALYGETAGVNANPLHDKFYAELFYRPAIYQTQDRTDEGG